MAYVNSNLLLEVSEPTFIINILFNILTNDLKSIDIVNFVLINFTHWECH